MLMISAGTTQFMMQSYNDVIKNNAFSKVGDTLSQAGKDINALANDYTNRQALHEKTKAQKIENQFALDTYDENAKAVGLKNKSLQETIKGQQLENQYASDTLGERVRAVGLKNKSMEEYITGQKIGNKAGELENKFTEKTQNEKIKATNARNILSRVGDNYLTDQTRLQHKSIQYQDVFIKDRNGKLRQATTEEIANPSIVKYKSEDASYNQHDAMGADANNKQVVLNRQAITQTAGKDFRNQEAQENLRLQQQAMQNKSAQAREEHDNYMRSFVQKLKDDGHISEFQMYNDPVIKYSDGKGQTHEILNPIHRDYLNANVRDPYNTQNLNVNMNANINNFNGQQGRNAEFIKTLNEPDASAEEKQNAVYNLLQVNHVRASLKELQKLSDGSIALSKMSEQIQLTGDKNRAYEFLGMIGKVIPGTSQTEIDYIQREYLNNEMLVKGVTKFLSGSLSDRDMVLLERLLPKMFSEDSTTGEVKILNLMNSQLTQYENQFANSGVNLEGWKTLHPAHYENYMRLKNNYNFMIEKYTKYKLSMGR